MRITIFSKTGMSLDLALRLQAEGHEVLLNILSGAESKIGQNMLHTTSKTVGMDADLVINDDTFYGLMSDKLRIIGRAVIGGSRITDRLEDDKDFGHSVISALKIKSPKSESFRTIDGAVKFMKENDGRYVLQPHGFSHRDFTYSTDDVNKMEIMLRYFESLQPKESFSFTLREDIEGDHVTVGAWFNGEKFCRPVVLAFEDGLALAYRTRNKLFNETLAKAETYLKTTGYRGYIALKCIVTDSEAYSFEWNSRFGDPSFFIQNEVHVNRSLGEFLYDLATGKTNSVPVDTAKWAVGVPIAGSPNPNSPVFLPTDLSHVHLFNIALVDNIHYQVGTPNRVCICTGSDVNLEKAINKAYAEVDKIDIPNSHYKSNVGDDLSINLQYFRDSNWL